MLSTAFLWQITHSPIQCRGMRKDTALSFRIPGRLKTELEKVALGEGRSLAQVCEVFLTKALEAYKEEGSKYVQRFFARQKNQPDTD